MLEPKNLIVICSECGDEMDFTYEWDDVLERGRDESNELRYMWSYWCPNCQVSGQLTLSEDKEEVLGRDGCVEEYY